jgi:hypothetical protein
MRITESGLRRIIRQELRHLAEGGEPPVSPTGGVRAFFRDGWQSSEEFSTPDELLSLLLTSESGQPSVALVVPDPHSYSGEPELIEVGNVSFESSGAAPRGWEDMWWWPLGAESARPDSNSVRAPRYYWMRDAAVASLQERQGESLHIFGSGAGLPQVKIRVTEVYEDTSHLPEGFSRDWWNDTVNGLKTEEGPVEWLGSDDQMVR